MENQKQKKSVGTIALVVLLLIVTIASLVLATYAWAKYSSKSDNNPATAQVAKWNVTFDSGSNQFSGTRSHIVTGNIAPGTKGSFDIEILPNDTEVCIAYQIAIDGVSYTNNAGSSLAAIEHLKFFTADDYTAAHEIALDGTVNSGMTGYIDLTDHNTKPTTQNSNKVTKRIFWVWPYDRAEASNYTAYNTILTTETTGDAYDDVDTAVGEGIESMTITYSLRAWQVDPADSEATDNTQTTNKPGIPETTQP